MRSKIKSTPLHCCRDWNTFVRQQFLARVGRVPPTFDKFNNKDRPERSDIKTESDIHGSIPLLWWWFKTTTHLKFKKGISLLRLERYWLGCCCFFWIWLIIIEQWVLVLNEKGLLTLFSSSLASFVRYGGRLSLHFKILSIVFFRFSPVNGG